MSFLADLAEIFSLTKSAVLVENQTLTGFYENLGSEIDTSESVRMTVIINKK